MIARWEVLAARSLRVLLDMIFFAMGEPLKLLCVLVLFDAFLLWYSFPRALKNRSVFDVDLKLIIIDNLTNFLKRTRFSGKRKY